MLRRLLWLRMIYGTERSEMATFGFVVGFAWDRMRLSSSHAAD
jgi:hypothetical protein